MNNNKALRGSVVFYCPYCETPNPVYEINNFKHLHNIKGGHIKCRICGGLLEIGDKRVYDFVEN